MLSEDSGLTFDEWKLEIQRLDKGYLGCDFKGWESLYTGGFTPEQALHYVKSDDD